MDVHYIFCNQHFFWMQLEPVSRLKSGHKLVSDFPICWLNQRGHARGTCLLELQTCCYPNANAIIEWLLVASSWHLSTACNDKSVAAPYQPFNGVVTSPKGSHEGSLSMHVACACHRQLCCNSAHATALHPHVHTRIQPARFGDVLQDKCCCQCLEPFHLG